MERLTLVVMNVKESAQKTKLAVKVAVVGTANARMYPAVMTAAPQERYATRVDAVHRSAPAPLIAAILMDAVAPAMAIVRPMPPAHRQAQDSTVAYVIICLVVMPMSVVKLTKFVMATTIAVLQIA